MNKKAFVLGDTITTIATIIALIFIMASFVMISTGISIIKKPALKTSSFPSENLPFPQTEGKILDTLITSRVNKEKYEEVTRKMQDKSLTQQQIEQLRAEQKRYAEFLSKYKTQIADDLAKANKNSQEEKCFILIEKQGDIQDNRLTLNDLDFSPTGKDIFISVKDGKAELKTDVSLDVQNKYAKTNMLTSIPELTVNLGNGKTKTLDVAYYYGVCR